MATAAPPEQPSQCTADIAAMELWDLINQNSQQNELLQHSFEEESVVPSVRPLYTKAQVNRTLIHPLLPQPNQEDERRRREEEVMKRSTSTGFVFRSRNDAEVVSASFHKSSCNFTQELAPATTHLPLHERIKLAMDDTNEMTIISDLLRDEDTASPTSTLNFPAAATATAHPSCSMSFETNHLNKTEMDETRNEYNFIVCADTQFGMRDGNKDWSYEAEISRRTVQKINATYPRPAFVTVCGDLLDMEQSFYKDSDQFDIPLCQEIQKKQAQDFKKIWSEVDPSVALVCLCGNHDVGNRPNAASIDRYKNLFGDDYLAFWTNGSYNIVVNTCLFSDPSDAQDLFDEHLDWLEGRLKYAREHGANHIFTFGHHPWFLYDENEQVEDLNGVSPFPVEWGPPPFTSAGFPDWYFHIKLKYRKSALDLFEKYRVTASFCGHFHQNLVSKTSWGMDHIVTAPLSIVLNSSGKNERTKTDDTTIEEENTLGVRIVNVKQDSFAHKFEAL